MTTPDYAALSQTLSQSLRLALAPIAVCLSDSVPEGIAARDGAAPAGCRFWQDAASGAFVTSAKDHELCAIGVYTHNLDGASAAAREELGVLLRVMSGLSYVRDDDIARIAVLRRKPRHVVYAPLALTPLPPDVVLLFSDARHALVVTEAIEQVEGRAPLALGRPACAAIPHVVNTRQAVLSLGCCGARVYVEALSDGVTLYGLPGDNLADYVERIAALSLANTTLTDFHRLRGEDIANGLRPTAAESVRRLPVVS